MRFHMPSPEPATLMWPSSVLYAEVGMLVGWSLPTCGGTSPFISVARGLEVEQRRCRRCRSELCTHWPLPETSRSSSAVMMPSAAQRPADDVGDRGAGAHRSLARQPGHRHQAAHALRDLVEARAVAVRARPGRSRRCWRG